MSISVVIFFVLHNYASSNNTTADNLKETLDRVNTNRLNLGCAEVTITDVKCNMAVSLKHFPSA